MTSVGSFEAKTHLPQLLARAAQGERIVITNRGKPVAMLARQYALTAYDAAYLELAIRRRAPLATLDAALMGAAETVGAAIFRA